MVQVPVKAMRHGRVPSAPSGKKGGAGRVAPSALESLAWPCRYRGVSAVPHAAMHGRHVLLPQLRRRKGRHASQRKDHTPSFHQNPSPRQSRWPRKGPLAPKVTSTGYAGLSPTEDASGGCPHQAAMICRCNLRRPLLRPPASDSHLTRLRLRMQVPLYPAPALPPTDVPHECNQRTWAATFSTIVSMCL